MFLLAIFLLRLDLTCQQYAQFLDVDIKLFYEKLYQSEVNVIAIFLLKFVELIKGSTHQSDNQPLIKSIT